MQFDSFIILHNDEFKRNNVWDPIKTKTFLYNLGINACFAKIDFINKNIDNEPEMRTNIINRVENIFVFITESMINDSVECVEEIKWCQEKKKIIYFSNVPYKYDNDQNIGAKDFLNKNGIDCPKQIHLFRNQNDVENTIKELTSYPEPSIFKKTLLINKRDYSYKIYIEKYKDVIDEDHLMHIENRRLDFGDLETYFNKTTSLAKAENEIIYCLFIADYYHLLDDYEQASKMIDKASEIALKNNIEIDSFINRGYISKGHIEVHLHYFSNAINEFMKKVREDYPTLEARNLFRLGETKLFLGEFEEAEIYLTKSINKLEGFKNNLNINTISDCYRKLGTLYNVLSESTNNLKLLKKAKQFFDKADSGYQQTKKRGFVWLLHEAAENDRLLHEFDIARRNFENAIIKSHEALNINRVAHGYLGLASIARLENKNVEFNVNINKALSIYKKINSLWGVIAANIEKILFYKLNYQSEEYRDAYYIAYDKNFEYELDLLKKIKNGHYIFKYPKTWF